jgi:ubiquinone/menaquinone biosynthesis C-methylase UbiE
VKAYYERRAREYDDWYLGTGLFAERDRPGWSEELDRLIAAIGALPPARTLDVACGTGFLTQHLPGEIVGLDQSDTMLELARERLPGAELVVGDALALPFEGGAFERVFASFFYCHLEEPERGRFLAEARRVSRELVVVGGVGDGSAGWDERVLNDGSRWQVYKRVFEPEALAAELEGDVLHAGRHFVAARAT